MGEVDEIGLVGVPSQQRCRVVHDRLLGVEMIQPPGERCWPLDVVPRRADDHDVTATDGIAPSVRPRSKTASAHRRREHRVISGQPSRRVVNRQQHDPSHRPTVAHHDLLADHPRRSIPSGGCCRRRDVDPRPARSSRRAARRVSGVAARLPRRIDRGGGAAATGAVEDHVARPAQARHLRRGRVVRPGHQRSVLRGDRHRQHARPFLHAHEPTRSPPSVRLIGSGAASRRTMAELALDTIVDGRGERPVWALQCRCSVSSPTMPGTPTSSASSPSPLDRKPFGFLSSATWRRCSGRSPTRPVGRCSMRCSSGTARRSSP